MLTMVAIQKQARLPAAMQSAYIAIQRKTCQARIHKIRFYPANGAYYAQLCARTARNR
jgi:hypothetical protein